MTSLLTPDQMAAARVAAAVRDLEAAAVLLDEAAQALSAIKGEPFARLYGTLQGLRAVAWESGRAIKAGEALHRLISGGVKLDHEPVTRDEALRWGAGWVGL